AFGGTSQAWAVVIGISKYRYATQEGLTNLVFADDDARAFTRSLAALGWNESHIRMLINEEATLRNVMIALESWLTKTGPDDLIVLFWSGHGFPDPEDPEKVYLACHDTDIRIPATGYRMDKVRQALEERRSRNVIVLADTCHAGKLITRGGKGISIVPDIDKMRREQTVPKGWIFMVGADSDRQAIEHTSWTNGAFTHSLLKGLAGGADGFESIAPKDGLITMRELRAYLNSVMPDETQRVLGVAKRPVITTSSGDPGIWNLSLQVP
ncbi:MAG: caspase family protein, partial [Deltaproteobacteria bacterium]|nr:caspase family protein [Deltaproteobacteria bacterium]